MIGLIANHHARDAGSLVLAALRRSVSAAQAQWISGAFLVSTAAARIVVVIDPDEDTAQRLDTWMARGPCKLILLGKLPPSLCDRLGLSPIDWPADPASWSRSPPAPTYGFAQSAAIIRYTSLLARFGLGPWQRPMERFDFTDEWNNLEFGAVRMDDSPWSLAMPVTANPESALAVVVINDQTALAYSVLVDQGNTSILWFNRQVGPIDSYEWRLVENFISAHRHETLPCNPVISEIPWGYDAAITMRLDCDEDVESARPLRQAYQEMGVPFSLAVHTSNLNDSRHHAILREMAAAGESILSHTATHAPNWGGSYEAALHEARESASRLQAVTGKPVRHAVSPFHQSPPYALAALADAGYSACIGGIIRNDPEFLMARGGHLAGLPQGFIGHSQQCMLHGDCMLAEGDPLAVFKQAFDQALATRTLFGYLDHPFSERYAYGWPDEATRIEMHRQFVAYIHGRTKNPLFMSEEDALDFLNAKASVNVILTKEGFALTGQPARQPLAVEFRGECRPASAGYFVGDKGFA